MCSHRSLKTVVVLLSTLSSLPALAQAAPAEAAAAATQPDPAATAADEAADDADDDDAPAPTPAVSRRLYLLFTADGRGEGLFQECEGPRAADTSGLARLAAGVEAERRWAEEQGLPAPLLMDAGDAMFPSRRSAWVAAKESSARDLTKLIRRVGYDVMATGNTTLAAPVLSRDRFLDAMKVAGLAMVASNVGCSDDPSSAACHLSAAGRVADRIIVERAGHRVGFFSVLPEDLAGRMAPENSTGLAFMDPVQTAREMGGVLRNEAADLVILLSHLDRGSTAPRRTLKLLKSLEPETRPDVTIAASTAAFTTHIRDPRVLAVAPGRLGRALLLKKDGAWELEWTDTVALPEVADQDAAAAEGRTTVQLVSATINRWAADYCAEHARPLPGGALTAPLTAGGFRKTVLEVMREQTGAEVALINTNAVEVEGFPIEGRVNAEQIRRALPYDNELRVITLRGYELELVFGPIAYAEHGTAIGLGFDATGRYTVNGRLIDPDGPYRIVTLDFVASGGDGILLLPPDRWRDAPPGPEGEELLADRLIHWFDVERGEGPYDPRVDQDLHLRPLWFGRSLLEVTMGSSFIDDPNSYYLPSLARQGQIDLNLGANVSGGVSTRDHKLLGSADVQYGRQRLETDIGSKEFQWYETLDYVKGRTSYSYEHFRNVVLGGVWYGPAMFLEGQVETEFQPATRESETTEGLVEDERYFEATTTAGVRFDPTHELSVQTGAGVRSPLLQEDAPTWPVANIRTDLVRLPFLAPSLEADPTGMLLLPPVHLSLAGDYWAVWKEGGAVHRMDASATVEVALVGWFSFQWSASGLMYVEPLGEAAFAFDNYVGVNLSVAGRRQDF